MKRKWTLFFNKSKHFIFQVFTKAIDPNTSLLPTSLAFYTILSLIPVLTILTIFLENTQFLLLIFQQLPQELEVYLVSILEQINQSNTVLLSTTTIASIYVGSQGIYALIRVINQMYGFEQKNVIINRAKAVLIMVLLIAMALFVVISFGILPIVLQFFEVASLAQLSEVLTVPVMYALITIIFLVIFYIAPNRRIHVGVVLPGAMLASVAIIVATFGFSIYVARFADFSSVYGPISNLVVLILLIYLLSYTVYVSICLNVVIYETVLKNSIIKKLQLDQQKENQHE